MGMLATVINSLALSSALEKIGQKPKSSRQSICSPIGEYYSKWRAIEAMQNGTVAIISGGTGNPFFTTDTGSALRGIEIEAEVMLKGTRVDGIYTADPEKRSYRKEIRQNQLRRNLYPWIKGHGPHGDHPLCKENHLPIIVFDMDTVGNLKKVLSGENIGTLVY